MYTPFEVFLRKKFKFDSSSRSSSNEEGARPPKEAKKIWKELSDKKRLKYIKKAELIYDQNLEGNKQPFHTYLNEHELELLLKSYGMPEKPPNNSRFFYIEKFKRENTNNTTNNDENQENEDEEATEETIELKASEKWKKLKPSERDKNLAEFREAHEAYELKKCNFLRSLPQQRVNDFNFYRFLSQQSARSREKLNSKSQRIKTEESTRSKKKRRKNRRFEPFERYVLENRTDRPDDETELEIVRVSRAERKSLRSQYNSLEDAKKLVYIKQAEEDYDSCEFDDDKKEKPLFTSFLSKVETKILFDSYNMPEQVPYNLASYYMKKMYQSGVTDVKVVFRRFREQSSDERETLSRQHRLELESYLKKHREFLERLPPGRLEDYNSLFKPNGVSKRNHNSSSNNIVTKKLRVV